MGQRPAHPDYLRPPQPPPRLPAAPPSPPFSSAGVWRMRLWQPVGKKQAREEGLCSAHAHTACLLNWPAWQQWGFGQPRTVWGLCLQLQFRENKGRTMVLVGWGASVVSTYINSREVSPSPGCCFCSAGCEQVWDKCACVMWWYTRVRVPCRSQILAKHPMRS